MFIVQHGPSKYAMRKSQKATLRRARFESNRVRRKINQRLAQYRIEIPSYVLSSAPVDYVVFDWSGQTLASGD